MRVEGWVRAQCAYGGGCGGGGEGLGGGGDGVGEHVHASYGWTPVA